MFKKIFNWIKENILFIITLFLLMFIPLYPKLPLLDIKHTWVYIRAEDFVVGIVFLLWIVLLLLKKVSLKTPLTMPIIIFWIAGVVSTIHGVLLIFPTLANVFPNLALLNYLRKIEYISLFFIAFSGIKDKKFLPYVVGVLAITLILVTAYGIGQKFYGLPAYLTMNEEFAKGIPIRLSPLSRVSSTFAGHYDLAAYLVLVIPILTSMFFAFKNWFVRIFLLGTAFSGFGLLFMTVSRSSFFVLLIALFVVLLFQKKRLALFGGGLLLLIIPIVLYFASSTSLLQRFGSTVKKVDVLVDASTGEVVGNVKEIPSQDFKDKIIKIRYANNKSEVYALMAGKGEDPEMASNSALIIPYSYLPSKVPLILEPRVSTGEDLPEGTGYINLTLTPISKKVGQFFYPRSENKEAKEFNEVLAIQGNFLIKRVSAYDLSFTTRFQGEWPKAIELFRENILFGSGYSSTGLAVDNNYLRILGEVGLIGFLSYFGILIIAGIYIKKILPEVNSPVVRSFVFGLTAGTLGLALNALLIDVFEASKIAFVFWMLIGVTIGTLHLYQSKQIDLFSELKKTITSAYAIVIYLFIAVSIGFSGIANYYFVGDDFTWFRWVADCQTGCPGILSYFTQADGFFYRPGAKIYFWLMYNSFWLNQTIYHMVSIFLHFVVAMLLFFLANKILKSLLQSFGASFLFIILSGYSEAVFWISSTGFLFNAIFILLGLLLFIAWEEKKKSIYFIFSLVSVSLSLLFHELGVIAPLLMLLYRVVIGENFNFKEFFRKIHYPVLFLPVIIYLIIRFIAGSHWFSGDYNYNLLKLPFNIAGNSIGYFMLDFFGPLSLALTQKMRIFTRENILFALLISMFVIASIGVFYRFVLKKMNQEDKKIIIFGFLFFIVSLLPFLGLGNITSRYSYLSSIGFILLFVFFLRQLYGYLVFNGREIAISILVIVIGIFSLIHIIQFDKVNRDWKEAGQKSQRFLISLHKVYENSWTQGELDLYFVNVPIKSGDAWVFPVGLKDAIWFVTKNKDINIYQTQSLDQALNAIEGSPSEKVFEFDESGDLIERKKINR